LDGTENGPIRRYRVQGLDSYGSPVYTGSASEEISMPAEFAQIELSISQITDVMYIAAIRLIAQKWHGMGNSRY